MSHGRFPARSSLYWSLRVCLGTLILGAGVGKALDIPGFVGVMETYELGLSEAALRPMAIGVVFLEVGLGSWILSGRRLRGAALLSAAMHTGYLILLIGALWRGLELQNCGCFGVFLARPLEWYTPLEDVALIAASFGLFYLSGGASGDVRSAAKDSGEVGALAARREDISEGARKSTTARGRRRAFRREAGRTPRRREHAGASSAADARPAEGGEERLHVAVVFDVNGVRYVAAATSRAALAERLAGYVLSHAGSQLWPADARRLRLLLAARQFEAAVEQYFASVGGRWDEERLVIETVDVRQARVAGAVPEGAAS